MLEALLTVAGHLLQLHNHSGHVASSEFAADLGVQHLGDIYLWQLLDELWGLQIQNFFQLASWCVAMVEGFLVKHQLLLILKDSFSLLSIYIISQLVFQILHFPVDPPVGQPPNQSHVGSHALGQL